MSLALTILSLVGTIGPSIIQAAEQLFSNKPKSGPAKAQAALQMAQAGIVAAIGIDPKAFGPPEQKLITDLNNAMVGYYNTKGWPTTPATVLAK